MNSDNPQNNNITRRKMLKYTGTGVAAGILSSSLGKTFASSMAAPGETYSPSAMKGKIPISLIIDDGSPVDPLFYELPGYETPFLVPAAFTKQVADTFDRLDIRGKFTLIPMPSCLGRIDQSLKRVPQEHLQEFLKLVRERIYPRFDITPEFLTHLCAYDLKTGEYKRHMYEDTWISQAQPEEIVEYFTLAFQILRNVGIEATGITSPWVSGIDVEKKYAKALGDAQWNLFKRKLTWYFLHAASDSEKPFPCSIEYKDKEREQVVVSVPSNAGDIFWSMDFPTKQERVKMINDGIDRLVSPDGRTGRIKQLMDSGNPVVIVTHWQSLFTQGTGLGLEGFTSLAERIQKVFGTSLEWVTCSELAGRFAGSQA
ncbi:MAG: hypothetical protein IPJ37_03800 [Bacteroidales bacterium]|nr:hypothetical protein [Bacteroidales bacterium]